MAASPSVRSMCCSTHCLASRKARLRNGFHGDFSYTLNARSSARKKFFQETTFSLQANAAFLREESLNSSSTCACDGKRQSGRIALKIAIGITIPRVQEDIS